MQHLEQRIHMVIIDPLINEKAKTRALIHPTTTTNSLAEYRAVQRKIFV